MSKDIMYVSYAALSVVIFMTPEIGNNVHLFINA